MKSLFAASLRYENNQLQILDQRLLPQAEVWLPCTSTNQLVEYIHELAIRGAPLIGIAAAIWIAHLAENQADATTLQSDIQRLRATRPTAVNLGHCMTQMHALLHGITVPVGQLVALAEGFFDNDVILCQTMSQLGADLIESNDNILTHCHTGALATAGIGTALGVIRTAHTQGKRIHVWVDETRPLLQGGRLTSWELGNLSIPYTLICDNMAAMLMQQGKINKIFVGADRIARNGDFANKIGTYGLAVCAHYHHIPFYVVAPRTTYDPNCLQGKDIPIEERDSREVKGVRGQFGAIQWAPENAKVYNPAFDITPAKFVTAWIFDTGICYHSAEIAQ